MIDERALIERLKARVGPPPAWVHLGIGDDAAVLVPERGELDVLTTDSLVEGVHFRRAWTDARTIGQKAVVVSLSDLAAMGATPRAVLLSLILPPALPLAEFDDLLDGVVSAAGAERATLVGGNLARSPGPMVIDVTALGTVRRRRLLRRGGGRAGDELYVTGSVGGATAGLAMLEAGLDRQTLEVAARDCVDRYERPSARVRCGRMVASGRAASASIDLSDGLAAGAAQLAEACGSGVVLDAGAIPVHDGARAWFVGVGADPVASSLAGGEDYELLFAVPPRRRRAFLAAIGRVGGIACTKVGLLTREAGAWVEREGTRVPLPTGFQHF